MPQLEVVSATPGAGKTAVAVALARGLAAIGQPVQLVRAGSGEPAAIDAVTFASYPFGASPGRVLTSTDIVDRDDQLTIVEGDGGGSPLTAGPAIIIVREKVTGADTALASTLGARLIGSIATAVVPSQIDAVARDLNDAGMRPIALLPESRALAAPSIAELNLALRAEVLYDGENFDEIIDDVVIAPVYTDPARPHFRRFASKAVVTPAYKTDLQLAAVEAGANCLVLTGGQKPSPYLMDRVQGQEITVLMTKDRTVDAVTRLGDVWFANRFRGDRKADAVWALVTDRIDFAALARKLT